MASSNPVRASTAQNSEVYGERNIATIDLPFAATLEKPRASSMLNVDPTARSASPHSRQAQADAKRFGADMARLYRRRLVDPALRSSPEEVWRTVARPGAQAE